MAELASCRRSSPGDEITMRNKLFILLYTSGIVFFIIFLNVVTVTIKKNPAMPLGPVEEADVSLGNYFNRPNSYSVESPSSRLAFLLEYFFPRTEALAPGCALKFSLVPHQKAIEPNGTATYAVRIANKGKETCENASLSMYYGDKESFVFSEPSPTASDYYWSLGNLEPGASYSLDLHTKISLPHGSSFIAEGCATADNSSDICPQLIMFVQEGASQKTRLEDKLRIPFLGDTPWSFLFRDQEFGIWVWDSPAKMSPAYAGQVISVAKQNGFNVIYITIDDYLEISQIPGREKAEAKEQYMKSLSIFIQAARGAGMEVDVVGGAKDWAIDANTWKGHELVKFVEEYNKHYPKAKVRGLQFDVEPYLLTEYNADKQKVLKEFVVFVDDMARAMKDVDAKLSVVIPHFYDEEQNWTPIFTYKGEKASTYTHLLRVLKQKKDTSIIIMAYRNFFDDENGVRDISEAEIKEASEGDYTTSIVLAQETGNVSPGYVTFYDYPKSSLFDALGEIKNHFEGYDNFGGVAVHYLDSFLKME